MISLSAKQTIAFGYNIGKNMIPGSVICLFGDLGTGKTTLIKGIVSALTGTKPEEVCSPTFTYMNLYEGMCPVYHFDLYRLRGIEDFYSLGFEEYLFGQGVCCLEWSERISQILPEKTHRITLNHTNLTSRTIIYEISKS